MRLADMDEHVVELQRLMAEAWSRPDAFARPEDSLVRPDASGVQPGDALTRPEDGLARPEDGLTLPGEAWAGPDASGVQSGDGLAQQEDGLAQRGDALTRPEEVRAGPEDGLLHEAEPRQEDGLVHEAGPLGAAGVVTGEMDAGGVVRGEGDAAEGWTGDEPVFTAAESEAMLQQVLRSGKPEVLRTDKPVVVQLDKPEVVRRLRWRRFAAAAVLVGALGLGGWWWARTPGQRQAPVAVVTRPAMAPVAVPGGNKAVLILANGSTVTLDSSKNGLLATQGTTNVVKVAGGQLAYSNGGTTTTMPGTTTATPGTTTRIPGATTATQGATTRMAGATTRMAAGLFNTIRTPRGGQYQVTLPDGSRVWLNAATALRFPTVFDGADRTVELTGEAYFEIAPRKDQPFHVKAGGMTVDVLGTHFNVMAYDDEESFRTTLLSGAVRIGGSAKTASGLGSGTILKPGEEARLRLDTREMLVAEADTDQVVAWKNGLFQFDGTRLEDVMRQVARWYDVDVRYAGTVQRHFSGMIARNAPLAEVLRVLEKAGKANFTLEGRTVTVTPK